MINAVTGEVTSAGSGSHALVLQASGRGRRDPGQDRRFVETNESEGGRRTVRFVAHPTRYSLIDDVIFVVGEGILLEHYSTVVTGVTQRVG